MSYLDTITTPDFLTQVRLGEIDGYSIEDKFGTRLSLSTSLIPITSVGTYQTPTSAQSLEILSSSGSDTAAGVGAQRVIVIGLSSTGAIQQESVVMNGTTAVALVNQYIRVFRMYVSSSGTYATLTAGSHVGTITLRGAGGGVSWAEISVHSGGLGLGQSQIGCYTVPLGKTAILLSHDYSVDANKAVNLYFFKREDILDVTTPFQPMRLQSVYHGITGGKNTPKLSRPSFPELTDIGFMGNTTTGTADCSVEFEMLLIDNA